VLNDLWSHRVYSSQFSLLKFILIFHLFRKPKICNFIYTIVTKDILCFKISMDYFMFMKFL